MAKFCTSCGAAVEENQEKCLSCGKVLNESTNQTTSNTTTNQSYTGQTNYSNNVNPVSGQKSKMAAGILGILLGSLGVHNFYLGYTSKAVCQLLLTLIGWILCGLGPIAAGIWGLVEGIMILTGSINKDGKGNPLGE